MPEFLPSSNLLDEISEWPCVTRDGYIRFMEVLRGIWIHPGSVERRGEVYCFKTAGCWGLNEIIYALQKNEYFWNCYWERSERGGIYWFCPLGTMGSWDKEKRK
jgi:hypothetical protein